MGGKLSLSKRRWAHEDRNVGSDPYRQVDRKTFSEMETVFRVICQIF